MVSVTKITKEYFEIESGDKIYFVTPLEKIPALKHFQEEINKKESEVRRLLELG